MNSKIQGFGKEVYFIFFVSRMFVVILAMAERRVQLMLYIKKYLMVNI